MGTVQATRQYLFKGQPMELADIPEDADYECTLKNEHDELLGAEVYQNGGLQYSQGICAEGESLGDAASRCVEIMRAGAVLPARGLVPVRVQLDPQNLEIPFEVEEDKFLVFFALYIYDVESRKLERNDQRSDETFQLEVLLQEPMGLVFKRAWLNVDGELLLVSYPFYSLSSYGTLRERVSFTEVSDLGEKLLVEQDRLARDSDFHSQAPVYYYPAGRDEMLAPLQPVVSRDHGVLMDAEGRPIDPEEMQHHEQVRQVFFSGDEKPLSVDHLLEGEYVQSEIIDIPIEQHYFAFHLYIRQLHRETRLIHDRSPLYVHVHSPLIHESSANIQLEEGQARQHTTTFYFVGNVIAHECKVFDADGNIVREYLMEAPGHEEGMIETTPPSRNRKPGGE